MSIKKPAEANKSRRSKRWKGIDRMTARRTSSPSMKRRVLVGEEKKTAPKETKKKQGDPESYTIMRYLGRPDERLKARARELEVIDVAPKETITFGSVKALEAYRRDLYQVNGQKTSHFRTSRRGLKLTIWRDE
ncbi:hypothetical protein vBCbaSRXM_65 [Citromicrobium phage vB_CbaS-RXM]|nr:hypothetical protein vBCbaSRXM_65 [Citromicrobium phage vB_CbaS-RXM]